MADDHKSDRDRFMREIEGVIESAIKKGDAGAQLLELYNALRKTRAVENFDPLARSALNSMLALMFSRRIVGILAGERAHDDVPMADTRLKAITDVARMIIDGAAK